jgi:hypothetical protein
MVQSLLRVGVARPAEMAERERLPEPVHRRAGPARTCPNKPRYAQPHGVGKALQAVGCWPTQSCAHGAL